MSNAIAGISLPANVVGLFRGGLNSLSFAKTARQIELCMVHLEGVLSALEHMQRLNRDGAQRLYQHAQCLADERGRALAEQRAAQFGGSDACEEA
jgi:hypothetical protein